MKNNILKNIPILIVYLAFLLYLIFGLSIFPFPHFVADFIGKLSPLFLSLIFLQIYLWHKQKINFLTIGKLIILITLFFINLYFLFDYQLSRILVNYFNIENLGSILNLLASLSGIILIIYSLIGSVLYLKKLSNK